MSLDSTMKENVNAQQSHVSSLSESEDNGFPVCSHTVCPQGVNLIRNLIRHLISAWCLSSIGCYLHLETLVPFRVILVNNQILHTHT